MKGECYDVLVVGGGINGTGIARDAAGRGLSVMLCETGRSGRAYVVGEHQADSRRPALPRIRRVRAGAQGAAGARGAAARAPHIMWPLRFVMPHMPSLRPAWMIRAGLFLYDHLARRELLPGSRGIDHAPPSGRRTARSIRQARLRLFGRLGRRCAAGRAERARCAERGATILTRTRCVSAVRSAAANGTRTLAAPATAHLDVRARAMVNAAGPWVGELLQGALGNAHATPQRAAGQGQPHRHAPSVRARLRLIFQNPDKRIIFAIPYEHEFTLIGTTDVEYHGDPSQVDDQRRRDRSTCATVNRYFKQQIAPPDVVLDLRRRAAAAGGRIRGQPVGGHARLSARTRYARRRRAAAVGVRRQDHDLPQAGRGSRRQARAAAASAAAPDLDRRRAAARRRSAPHANFERFLGEFRRQYPWLPARSRARYARAYGTRAASVIGAARSVARTGRGVRAGALRSRTALPVRQRMGDARADDMLWRRTKLGLHIGGAARRSEPPHRPLAGERRRRPCLQTAPPRGYTRHSAVSQ